MYLNPHLVPPNLPYPRLELQVAGMRLRFDGHTLPVHPTVRFSLMARTKPPSNKVLTIRLPVGELERLEEYCLKRGKTKTDVLREMIRKLRV